MTCNLTSTRVKFKNDQTRNYNVVFTCAPPTLKHLHRRVDMSPKHPSSASEASLASSLSSDGGEYQQQTVGRKRSASNEDFSETPIKRSSSDCCLKSNRMEVERDIDTSAEEVAVGVGVAPAPSSPSSEARVELRMKMKPPTSTSTSMGKSYTLKPKSKLATTSSVPVLSSSISKIDPGLPAAGGVGGLREKSKSSHALGRAGLSFSQQNSHSIKSVKSYASDDFGLGIPSTSLTRLNRSNSSFLNSYLSKNENTLIGDRVNASFTFIQRSDKESLMRTVNQIQDLVNEQKQEETREREREREREHAQKELNNNPDPDPVDETEHDFQETSKAEEMDLSRSISTIKSQEEVSPSFYSTAASAASGSNTTTAIATTTTTTSTSLDSLSSRYHSRASTICRHLVRLHSYVQDEFYRIVLGVSALKVTLEAMDTFPHHEFVQATCNLTLGGLCQSNLMNGLTLVKSGGVVSILNSIKLFPDSSHVCSMAVNCLALATSTTELAVLYLKQMKDGRKTIEAIPDSMLSFEAPKNKDLILKRIESATL